MSKAESATPLTDPRLVAAATLPSIGGRLQDVTQDPTSGRLTFYVEGLSPTFVREALAGQLTVNLADFISALDRIMGLIHQYRVRRNQ